MLVVVLRGPTPSHSEPGLSDLELGGRGVCSNGKNSAAVNRGRNNEKRRWRRHPLSAPIRLLTQKVSIDGRGVTMSEGGMCLFALVNLGIGTPVEVEFMDPQSHELVRAHGAVRNRAAYLYGIEFLVKRTHSF